MKSDLRAQFRQKLAGMTPGTVRAHSAAVWERLATLAAFQTAQCLCVYVSTGAEIETHGLIRQLLARGRRVCVPGFVTAYVPAEIKDFDADLVVGRFGILEPKTVIPAQPDLWLVPGLGFDRSGNRLGRGKGFFDAMLQGAAGVKIGVGHDFQIVDKLPIEPHDVRLDFVVTEGQTFRA
ncbi:MAG: 5-formyltetrahydrofolate cyclo-ligase [Verrucomicrobiota bacterium]